MSSQPGPLAPAPVELVGPPDEAVAELELLPCVPVLVGPLVLELWLPVLVVSPPSSPLQPVHISKTSDEDTKTFLSVAFMRSVP